MQKQDGVVVSLADFRRPAPMTTARKAPARGVMLAELVAGAAVGEYARAARRAALRPLEPPTDLRGCPVLAPAFSAAAERVAPARRARLVPSLIRENRVDEALAAVEAIIAEADRD